jgi:hypothetical protein
MLFRVLLGTVRVVVLVAVLGVIGYVIYDNTRPDPSGGKSTGSEAPPPKAGDMAAVTGDAIGCPVPEDVLKVKNLLRTNTDRQPAASYSVDHGCVVLSRVKDYRIQAYSAKTNAVCLQVPGQTKCQWAPVESLRIKQSAPSS